MQYDDKLCGAFCSLAHLPLSKNKLPVIISQNTCNGTNSPNSFSSEFSSDNTLSLCYQDSFHNLFADQKNHWACSNFRINDKIVDNVNAISRSHNGTEKCVQVFLHLFKRFFAKIGHFMSDLFEKKCHNT